MHSLESNVVSYVRSFPFQFEYGKNATLTTVDQENYIDFFAGAGAINFGHNNPQIKEKILDYLSQDRLIHALDLSTVAREEFLNTFQKEILEPRNLNYKIMSCGPTGTNAVEAALKLARKVKNRRNIFAFTGAFHGMSLGALALTSDRTSRNGAGVPLDYVTRIPYYDQYDSEEASLNHIRELLEDDHSGVELPAAIILETVQAEGGVNVAPVGWLKELRQICDEFDILLLVDDIQAGVGRTGTFFSFERAEIVPDMVMVSKSISGFGLPLSLLLFKPELDAFTPAEHNGTFRGNQLGFVGCKAALEYFNQVGLDQITQEKGALVEDFLYEEILAEFPELSVRGIGLMWGIDFSTLDAKLAKKVQRECVKNGLIIELAGREDAVLKILPPLTIPVSQLQDGLATIKQAILHCLALAR